MSKVKNTFKFNNQCEICGEEINGVDVVEINGVDCCKSCESLAYKIDNKKQKGGEKSNERVN